MFLTHRFGSVDTLDRARHWLTHHGFEVARVEAPEHDETRLSMRLDLSEVSAALSLIDSIERTDPRGWPGMLDLPEELHAQGRKPRDESPSPKATTPIHWQAHHEHPSSDPLCCKICEYMFSRSE